MTELISYAKENWDLILTLIGTLSVLGGIFAKLTKNKTDDKIVAFLQKLLDLGALNRATKAGEDALAANPAEGLEGVVGTPKDVN